MLTYIQNFNEATLLQIYVESSTSELLARRCGSVIPAPFSVYGSTVIIKSTSKPNANNLWKIKYHSGKTNFYYKC